MAYRCRCGSKAAGAGAPVEQSANSTSKMRFAGLSFAHKNLRFAARANTFAFLLLLKQAFEFFAMTKPKKRIEINARQEPLTNLREAEINLPNLPDGPEELPNVSQSLWKLGRVVLRRERAHRGGKTVIVIDDFATHLPISVIEKTAKKIRLACGCGGTVKDRVIEIQGDQPGKIRAILETEGFLVAGVK
jgi:translation initiation factor 1